MMNPVTITKVKGSDCMFNASCEKYRIMKYSSAEGGGFIIDTVVVDEKMDVVFSSEEAAPVKEGLVEIEYAEGENSIDMIRIEMEYDDFLNETSERNTFYLYTIAIFSIIAVIIAVVLCKKR
jgi:hypothetical protein